MPDLADCAPLLAAPTGHADCALPRGPDNLARVQLAWEETRSGGELTAVRLLFDPQHTNHLKKYRSTLWEIHPITKIEVWDTDTEKWVDLDDVKTTN